MKLLLKIVAYILLVGIAWFTSCKKEYSCENCGVNPPGSTNKSPVANAGPDQIIILPMDSVSLDGSASHDPDGTVSSFQWTKITGPASFVVENAAAARTVVKNLLEGVYQFELKVTDNEGLWAKGTVQVIVKNDSAIYNLPPVAKAGPDQTITLPLDYTYLDGSGSSPNGWPYPNGATYVWTKISGPSQFLLSPATLQETFQIAGYVPTTAIAKDLIPGSYLFRLQVTNSLGVSDADTVQVEVVEDPQNTNTVTYHDLIWGAGDVYGLGLVDIFLTTSIRPDLFYSYNSYRPIQVYLNLDASAAWISVHYGGNNLYTYDEFPVLLWIICYPNNALLVGQRSSIKIKFL